MLLPVLRLVPIWAWALAAAVGWGAWQQRQAAQHAALQAVATQRAIDSEASRARETRAADIIHEIESNARMRSITTRRAVAAGSMAGDGLRVRAAATTSAAASAATAGRCDDAGQAAGMLSDVLTSLDRRGRAVSAWADELDIALEACQRAYDAVTAP